MKIEVLKPSGYCAGVANAIKIAIKTKENNKDKNVVVLGMLVHNEETLKYLNSLGINTLYDENKSLIDLAKNLKNNDLVILTAHGHSASLEVYLRENNIEFVDTTCPFVKKTIDEIQSFLNKNKEIVYIGKKNHPEANAVLSLSNNIHLCEVGKNNLLSLKSNDPLIFSQTTFSNEDIKIELENIKEHFSNAYYYGGICNSSQIRQNALISLKQYPDVIIIVGSRKSNNTSTLYSIAKSHYPKSRILFVENEKSINKEAFANANYVVISSGASTPNELINRIVNKLSD